MTTPHESTVPIPALLRAARGAYARAIRGHLFAAGYEDLPRNAPFILGGMANWGGSAAQLVGELGVTKQAASQLIDTLVVRGYLERSSDASDRRRNVLGLTDRGRGAAAAVRTGISEVDGQLGQRCSEKQLTAFREVLTALVDVKDRTGLPT